MDTERYMKSRKAIENIMSTFEFDKVHAYMTTSGWKWGRSVTPTIDELKATAHELLTMCANAKDPNHGSTATGGFEARLDGWSKDGTPYLSLLFYITRKTASLD
jgi:hypothetical protein